MRKPTGAEVKKALKFAFMPEFGRITKSYSRSYRNVVNLIVQVFVGLQLLDKTHPIANFKLGRPAALTDVLGTAWLKVDWRRPASPATVMFASVFLLVVSTGIAVASGLAAGLLATAEAGVFSITTASTDKAMQYMRQTFGETVGGVAPTGVDPLITTFKGMMAGYSSAMLVLGGFILLYIILNAVMATAQEGRFGGSGFNNTWTPIRLAVAIGLLVPLSASGYNAGQMALIKVAEWGSALGTNLWAGLGPTLAARGKVILTPEAPDMTKTVAAALESEMCLVTKNNLERKATGDGAVAPADYVARVPVTRTTLDADASNNDYLITYKSPGGKYECPTITIKQSIAGSTDAMTTAMEVAHIGAFNTMLFTYLIPNVITPAATDINKYITEDGVFLQENFAADFATEIRNIERDYQTDVQDRITASAAGETAAASAMMTTSVRDSGWLGASTWFASIARVNATRKESAASIPTASAAKPAGSGWGETMMTLWDKATSAVGEAVTGMGKMVERFTDTGGQFGDCLTSETMVSCVIGKVMMKSAAASGSPFKNFGPATALSSANPLAAIASIGGWMIDVAVGAIAAVTILSVLVNNTISDAVGLDGLVAVATPVMMGLAGTFFSGGVLLFYFLPMLPFIRFMFNFIGWLINILEGIISMPLVALAHLTTRGEGIMAGMAQQGYMLALAIFLKPSLFIIGITLAFAMLGIGVRILNDLYSSAAGGWRGGTTNTPSPLAMIIYTVLYAVIVYSLANMCFKMIEGFAERALSWIGGPGLASVSADENVMQGATLAAGGAGLAIAKGAGSLAQRNTPTRALQVKRGADGIEVNKAAAREEQRRRIGFTVGKDDPA